MAETPLPPIPEKNIFNIRILLYDK